MTVADLETLETYLDGVMNRSEHHAETVGAIALALIGAVLWRKDPEPIEVRTCDGRPANILWMQISGRRYALAYNQRVASIQGGEGEALFSFNNNTSVTEVHRIFRQL